MKYIKYLRLLIAVVNCVTLGRLIDQSAPTPVILIVLFLVIFFLGIFIFENERDFKNNVNQQPVKSNTNATLLSIDDFNKYDNNLSEFYISNITKITKAFYKELKRVETLYLVNEDIIRKDFNTISKQISTLPFEVCSIEITSDNSIKFTLIFPENRVVMVTKITNKDYDFGKDDIIYSYFINRNLIASDVTPIQSFTENFKGYILQELV